MALQEGYETTLTKVGLKYMQDPNVFQATRIFPACPVNLLSSKFPTYDKEYWMKNEADIRTPGTISVGGTHARGTDSYQCEEVAYHEDVPAENVNNDPAPLNPLRAATRRVTQKISIYDEVNFITNFFSTGTWGTNEDTPGTLWSAGGDPLGDVDGYKRAIRIDTAREPNKFVISRQVYDVLKRHSDLKEQIKYTSAQNITPDLLARLFEIDEVIVLNAVYDSAAYGAAASQSFMAGKHALLLHTTSNPSLEEPSAGYNFEWTGSGSNGYSVRSFYEDKPKSYFVEASYYHVFKQLATDLGYFIKDPVA